MPSVILLITLPCWLTVNAMGRYLLVLTAIVYFMFAAHTLEAFQLAKTGAEPIAAV